MKTTEKNYLVNYENAYSSVILMSVEFFLNGVNYEAKGYFIYSDIIETIEVLNLETDEFIYDEDDEAWILGNYLLYNMSTKKHLAL